MYYIRQQYRLLISPHYLRAECEQMQVICDRISRLRENENLEKAARAVQLKRNISLTDADLASLEELLFNAQAVESRERFEEVYRKTPMKITNFL